MEKCVHDIPATCKATAKFMVENCILKLWFSTHYSLNVFKLTIKVKAVWGEGDGGVVVVGWCREKLGVEAPILSELGLPHQLLSSGSSVNYEQNHAFVGVFVICN